MDMIRTDWWRALEHPQAAVVENAATASCSKAGIKKRLTTLLQGFLALFGELSQQGHPVIVQP